MAAAAVENLTSELGAKAQIDAISRDYIVEPRLGGCFTGLTYFPLLEPIFWCSATEISDG